MKILLFGANEGSSAFVARSLFKMGLRVDILDSGSYPISRSIYINKYHNIESSFERETQRSVIALERVLRENDYDALIPIHDTALCVCEVYYKELSQLTKILHVNAPDTQLIISNKLKLLELCLDEGVPAPYTRIVSNLSDINVIAKSIKYPCMARPVSSRVYKEDKIYSYTAKRINNEIELIDFLSEKVLTVQVMVQELLAEGFGVGFNYLCKDGLILQSYSHQRIDEAWGGGQSTYRKTISNNLYEIQKYSQKIIQSSKISGIGMIEFRISNGRPYIMEINGRPWGSIELGIAAGCDIPADMIRSFLLNQSINKFVFKEPYYSINLWKGFLWIMNSGSKIKIWKWLLARCDSLRKNHTIEDSIVKDPLFRVNLIINDIWSVLIKRIQKHVLIYKYRNSPLMTKQLINQGDFAFICKGNINRSAFASEYFNNEYSKIYQKAHSRGLIFEENRISPYYALGAAKKYGIDLSLHRSKYLSNQDTLKFRSFIVMDYTNYFELIRRGISASRIYRFAECDIQDPYSKNESEYEEIFKLIVMRLNKLF